MIFTIEGRQIKLTYFQVNETYSGNLEGSTSNNKIELILADKRYSLFGDRHWNRFSEINHTKKLPAFFCIAVFDSSAITAEYDGTSAYCYWFQDEIPDSIYDVCLDKLLPFSKWPAIAKEYKI